MSHRATHIGFNQVLEFYQDAEYPAFAIFDGSIRMKTYAGNDFAEGENKLQNFINELTNAGSFKTFELCIFDKGNKTPQKKDAVECCRFAAVRPPEIEGHRIYGGGAEMAQKIAVLESKINALIEMQAAPDDEDEGEDEAPENKYMGVINGINTILSHPIINNVLANLLTKNPTPPIGPGTGPTSRPVALAGVDNDVEVLQLWAVLESKGANVEHLRKLAGLDKNTLVNLLKML